MRSPVKMWKTRWILWKRCTKLYIWHAVLVSQLLLQPALQLGDGHAHLRSHKKQGFLWGPKAIKILGRSESALRKSALRSDFFRRQGGGMEQEAARRINKPASPPAKPSAR